MEADYSTSPSGKQFAVLDRTWSCRTLVYPHRDRPATVSIDELRGGDHFLDYEVGGTGRLEPTWYIYQDNGENLRFRSGHWEPSRRAAGCASCEHGVHAQRVFFFVSPTELDSIVIGNMRVAVYSDGRIVHQEILPN